MDAQCDKFSDLPLHLVLIIISYLSFPDAFRLCLLRKEWLLAKLWRNCSSLELQETSFNAVPKRRQWSCFGQNSKAYEMKGFGRLRFIHFLNILLPQLVSPVFSSFSVQMAYASQYHDSINGWIDFALSKYVQEFYLDLSDGDPLLENMAAVAIPIFVLPKFFYQNGKCIVVLSLTMCCLNSHDFSCFRKLRILVMKRVEIAKGKVTDLLLNCPLLEDLELVECCNLLKVELLYSLETLKKLVVRHCVPLTEGIELVCLTLLAHFEYAGKLVEFSIDELNGLEEVFLDFHIDSYHIRHFQELREALVGFTGAMTMTITTIPFKVLPLEYLSGQPLLQLKHVRHLTLMTCMRKYELPGILSLLKGATRLESLCIKSVLKWPRVAADRNDDDIELPEDFWTPQVWTLDHLERIQVDGFTGKENELHLLKFLMRNAKKLHKIFITPWVRGTASLELFGELETMELASKCICIEWSFTGKSKGKEACLV